MLLQPISTIAIFVSCILFYICIYLRLCNISPSRDVVFILAPQFYLNFILAAATYLNHCYFRVLHFIFHLYFSTYWQHIPITRRRSLDTCIIIRFLINLLVDQAALTQDVVIILYYIRNLFHSCRCNLWWVRFHHLLALINPSNTSTFASYSGHYNLSQPLIIT